MALWCVHRLILAYSCLYIEEPRSSNSRKYELRWINFALLQIQSIFAIPSAILFFRIVYIDLVLKWAWHWNKGDIYIKLATCASAEFIDGVARVLLQNSSKLQLALKCVMTASFLASLTSQTFSIPQHQSLPRYSVHGAIGTAEWMCLACETISKAVISDHACDTQRFQLSVYMHVHIDNPHSHH